MTKESPPTASNIPHKRQSTTASQFVYNRASSTPKAAQDPATTPANPAARNTPYINRQSIPAMPNKSLSMALSAYVDPVGQRRIIFWTLLGLLLMYLYQTFGYAMSIWQSLSGGDHAGLLPGSTALPSVYGSSSPMENRQDLWMLMKWVFLWTLVPIMLYLLQVPKLRLGFWQLVVVLLLVTWLQVALFFPGSAVSVRRLAQHVHQGRVLAAEERRVLTMFDGLTSQTRDRQDFDSMISGGGGISGSFTVKVVPYSLAELNPKSTKFCIPLRHRQGILFASETIDEVDVPVLLSGVVPWTIHYSFQDYYSGQTTQHQLRVDYNTDSKMPAEFTAIDDTNGESKYKWVSIKVQSAGILKLDRLVDGQGEGDGVINGDAVRVELCPEAFWYRPGPQQRINDLAAVDDTAEPINDQICHGGNYSQALLVYGVAPLNIEYLHVRDSRQLDKISIQHVDDNSAQHLPGIRSIGRSNAFAVQIDAQSLEAGKLHEFQIVSAVDAQGKKKEYFTADSSDKYSIFVHEKPSAALLCEQDISVITENGDMTKLKRADVSVPVKFSGSPPFQLEYTYTASDGKLFDSKMENIQSNQAFIPISTTGSVKLKSVSDKNCIGIADSTQVCKIVRLAPPTINIETHYVEQQCFGNIGFSFDLRLTGTGPWYVWYDLESQSGRATTKKRVPVVIANPSESIQFKPPLPGLYTVTFVEFKDSKYPETIPIDNVTVQQQFHAPSSVKLESITNRICINQAIDIQARLSGSGPWNINYEIITPSNKRMQFTAENIDKELFTLHTPEFTESGRHYVEFKKIVDKNGCETALSVPASIVDVMEMNFVASFRPLSDENVAGSADDSSLHYSMVEGRALKVPIHLAGSNAPWNVEIQYSSFSTQDKWQTLTPLQFRRPESASFTIARPGAYKISSVKDEVCPGTVSSPNKVVVTLLPKPTAAIELVQGESLTKYGSASLNEYGVCRSAIASMKVKVDGKSPFTFKYRISKRACTDCQFLLISNEEIKLAQHEAVIDLSTEDSGDYMYEAVSITDALYENVQLDARANAFVHRVFADPQVALTDDSMRNVCVGHKLPTDRLPEIIVPDDSALDESRFPLKVTYDMILESGDEKKQFSKSTTIELKSKSSRFNPETPFDTVGTYSFNLRSVEDARGCKTTYSPQIFLDKRRQFRIHVSTEPTFSVMSTHTHGCIGDKIGFSIFGLPPWTLRYSWTSAPLSDSEEPVTTTHEMKIEDDEQSGWIVSKLMYLTSVTKEAVADDLELAKQQREAQKSGLALKNRNFYLRFSKPGLLQVHEVCHGQMDSDSCCVTTQNWQFSVHALPSAHVSGSTGSKDATIRQGDAATMKIDFQGEPPYSFTYSRTAYDSGHELDSHAVNNITESSYELAITQPGRFTVTSISDKYCRYP